MGMRRGKTLLAGAAVAAGMIAVGGLALASDDVDLDARLSGANEVPPADPDGDGKADVEWEINGDEVCFDVKFDDIGTPNRGHIHTGVAGVNGGIVVTFFELGPPRRAGRGDPRNDEIEKGRLRDCVDPVTGNSTRRCWQRIRANPAELLRQPAQLPVPGWGGPRPAGGLSSPSVGIGPGGPIPTDQTRDHAPGRS